MAAAVLRGAMAVVVVAAASPVGVAAELRVQAGVLLAQWVAVVGVANAAEVATAAAAAVAVAVVAAAVAAAVAAVDFDVGSAARIS